MKEQEKINSLIEVCHKAAKDKGFWDEPRNQGEAFALILSELFEAFEAHRKGKFANMEEFLELTKNGKYNFENSTITTKTSFEYNIKDSFEDEIADTFVRLFDFCGGFGVYLSYSDMQMREVITDNFGQTLLNISLVVSNSYFKTFKQDTLVSLYYFLLLIVEKYDIDIERHIELKLKYNASRPYKHGKQY